MKLKLKIFMMSLLAATCLFAAKEDSGANAILRLLNARASGSYKGYAEAAEEVLEQAKQGKFVYAYVIALMSRDQDAPPAAKLDTETRDKFFAMSRAKMEKIANSKNNSMALYLLSLDRNDTNLLHRAAAEGNVQAENAWGSLLFTSAMRSSAPSNQVEKTLALSYKYFKSAAGKGDANGLYNLGVCLWRGLGVNQDVVSAFNCFRNASEQGHAEAINNIGAFYREGIVVEKDLSISAKWFEKSAAFGNPFGQYNYALALIRGEGVTKDPKAAIPYLEKSSASGCVEAMDTLGVSLWKGEGIDKDPRKAFSLFMKAAAAGYPPAMENIATCYERGSGAAANEKLALEWRIRSRAARGDRNAQAWLLQNANRE